MKYFVFSILRNISSFIRNTKYQILYTSVIGLLVCIGSILVPRASAQTNSISVSPSIIQLDLATDKPEAILYYSNNTTVPVEISLKAQDVTELEDGYKLSFLKNKNDQNYKYGLSSWISFNKQSFILDSHEKTTITVFINKEKLSPGGHYASILASIQQSDKTQGQITINSILGSLIFVRTHTGKELEQGFVQNLSSEQNGLFNIQFNNTGDTYLTPYGLLQVYDMFGRPITKGILNENSLPTLPESIRTYTIHTQPTNTFLLPGIYTATLSLHFGKDNKQSNQKIRYFSEGSIPLLPVSIGIIVCLVVYILYRKRTTIE